MQLLKGQFAPEPIQLDRLQCAALAPEVDRGLQFGSVCCVMPVSSANLVALMASAPVIRSTICCLNAIEKGFVIPGSVFAPRTHA